ncbi:metalloendopeptidase NDAI_0E02010 [Naumovozyma dairenensis CBS 421]|uniref:Mitochondrial intermediate peptidase n=1 Tax=Naumovozyma dairenensis (strain ATCC 10597 / BCRC 20456 / CBS 421 / NBRC 0211 / NRRL Y-12639) TaxID=1071378 RepID=G0WB97_NAUDC|nr:hypothetical protein NDAI_0E02010 [Naumovozyma dairenensis CBS 421]CCD25017.1 hypothetical protein NDAI_0E02010 [Naumovozyma dairenensis CBS 421]
MMVTRTELKQLRYLRIFRNQVLPTKFYRSSVRRNLWTKQQDPPLKRVFDDSQYWVSINNPNNTYTGKILSQLVPNPATKTTGLFANPYLTTPSGLREFSDVSLAKAKKIIDNLKSDRSLDGKVNFVIELDRLSDTLCRVIDLCEFIRSAHPEEGFIEAAQDCHEKLFEFMNVLNTDRELCELLNETLQDEQVLSKLSEEEKKVGYILLQDFIKSGIYMDSGKKDQFITLSQDISVIGQEYINNINQLARNHIKVKRSELDNAGIEFDVACQLGKDITGKYYKIPTYGHLPFLILKACTDPEIRKKIWVAMHDCSKQQIERLTNLVKIRAFLAHTMGRECYAAYAIDGKMAKNPKDVDEFLKSLMDFLKPKAAKELKFISDLIHNEKGEKPSDDVDEILTAVRPWDREYYTAIHRNKQKHLLLDDYALDVYYPLGNVIQGLSDIFESIYGIRFEPAVAGKGETWSSDVRRLNVVSEKEGLIGIIYCDLFRRQGKTNNAAHFTICCSRQIYPHEDDFSTIQLGTNVDGTKFQLPIISLLCNFNTRCLNSGETICLLALNEIETLFHEMGHAIHSMLGRTRLQNVSGTRCSTDFVELPSVLMEHFARDTRVLKRIGHHYKTGDRVPATLLNRYLEKARFLKDCETFSQAKMAMLDQRLYDKNIVQNIDSVDVVKIYHELEKELEVLVDDESNWCAKFGHLFGYGATYYCYLFDRAIASKVWKKLFEKDPYSRSGGEKFKNDVLKWGGLREPWNCVADVLDNPDLAHGGEKAMKFIGHVDDI